MLTSQQAKSARADRMKELAKDASLSVVGEGVESKLLQPTKASLSNRLTAEELDHAERKRSTRGAHDSKVAFGGYDLKFSGRAIPAWTRPPL